ncbi:helix-turn-helix domain-containing protein [Olsenella sp. Marseille-QA0557]|uniref:helix-turn-helix domain-containing protein n=1 Tax=Olsenella sp. Marseille-QA0557 TaxID=3378782 RepID=UPI003D110C3B
MRIDRVILDVVEHSTMTGEQVSAALGKSRAFVSVAGGKGRSPRLDTVADVADVCGVDVVLIDRETGEKIGAIEPPRRGQNT